MPNMGSSGLTKIKMVWVGFKTSHRLRYHYSDYVHSVFAGLIRSTITVILPSSQLFTTYICILVHFSPAHLYPSRVCACVYGCMFAKLLK